jgi:hypothetical protein
LIPSTIDDELTIMASAPASAMTVSAVRCGNLEMLSAARKPSRWNSRSKRGRVHRLVHSVICGMTSAAPRNAKNEPINPAPSKPIQPLIRTMERAIDAIPQPNDRR